MYSEKEPNSLEQRSVLVELVVQEKDYLSFIETSAHTKYYELFETRSKNSEQSKVTVLTTDKTGKRRRVGNLAVEHAKGLRSARTAHAHKLTLSDKCLVGDGGNTRRLLIDDVDFHRVLSVGEGVGEEGCSCRAQVHLLYSV
jgi:hypothetical protein